MDKMVGVEGDWKNYTFKIAQPEDYPKILKHLEENYYLDEALNKHSGQSEERIADMNFLGTEYMKQNLSIFAYDRDNNNKVVGVRVTGISRKDEEDTITPTFQAQISKEMFPAVDEFFTEIDTYGKLGIDHYADFLYMSVDREYRGRGLAQQLYDRAIKLLEAKGVPAAQSLFSNPISQAIARKLEFVELGRKYLKDFKRADGTRLLPGASDEEVAIVMAKLL